ncbi:MAG: tRNA (N(6)-L-threonylcarbamoyladenosine(37)-C(2))-methylthiotransferase MtaB [Bacteroidales bacterium]|nr:tRNA (N(6)-L-threonylcarbamoyladenosine(37)-C(2))-methylthiotransferase MtaB [Bacteroidales bacterium]
MQIYFSTLGCKLNYTETSALKQIACNEGYTVTSNVYDANIIVVNTCTVTHTADKKSRYAIRHLHQLNPQAAIIVTGCYADTDAEVVKSIEGVTVVFSNQQKQNFAQILKKLSEIKTADNNNNFFKAYSVGGRTRSFLKVQDGCNYFCSYCKVPFARGRSRNVSIKEILEQVKEIEKHQVKEIVLSGINIGDFGHSTGETFLELIKALEENTNIPRFRISSIEPNLLTYEIIDFVLKSKRFMPHFHIPLQSGSDIILKQMNRKYTKKQFIDKIEYIRSKSLDAAIGIDVIVGFPGETEVYFNETFELLENIEFSYLHVFEYSDRKGTKAFELNSKVKDKEKKERSVLLRNLSQQKEKAFALKFINTRRKVLVEKKHDSHFITGLTDNYLNVKIPYNSKFINEIVDVLLICWDAEHEMLIGKV